MSLFVLVRLLVVYVFCLFVCFATDSTALGFRSTFLCEEFVKDDQQGRKRYDPVLGLDDSFISN